MFSFGLSSVTTEVSVTDFEHVFFCWEKYGITIVVVLILKYLTQQAKLTQSSNRNPKARCETC